ADRKIEEYNTEEVVVSGDTWRRELEDPEWHQVANTVLEAADDAGITTEAFRKGAEQFINDKKEQK
ncbi:MAG: hypothetical protein ABEJ66_03845, partial [Candidatus Nanohaloarchaea archaeon]